MSDSISTENTIPKQRKHKWLKAIIISLCSLIGVTMTVVIVALYLIFTPARLTSIVNKLSDKFILCESHFNDVDFTLFKTFPHIGLDVKDAVLINPTEGYDQDTLADIGNVTIGFNLRDYLRNREIKITGILIDQVFANAYIGKDGKTNFDIFPTSTDTSEGEPFFLPDTIDIKKLKITSIFLNLTDHKDGLLANGCDGDIKARALYANEIADAEIGLNFGGVICTMLDSLNTPSLKTVLHDASLNLVGKGSIKDLAGNMTLKVGQALLNIGNETYINENLQEKGHLLTVKIPYEANLEKMDIQLNNASLNLADYIIRLSGHGNLADSVRPMSIDATFETNQWGIAELLTLLPHSIATLLPQEMKVDGIVELKGTAVGSVTDSTMPLISANLKMADGTLSYPSVIPFPVKKINGDLDAHLDFSKNEISSATINRLDASAMKSSLSLSGKLNDLMGNMLADVHLKGNINLPDVKPFLPDSLLLDAKGKSKMDVSLRATLDQITDMNLKAMKVRGTLDCTDLDVNLGNDILAQSPHIALAIQIPARKQTESFAEMMSANITSGTLHAQMRSMNIDAQLNQASLQAGLNDFMDDTQPFRLVANIKGDKLIADMDSMEASISEPDIFFEMVPSQDDPAKVKYKINYNSSALYAKLNDSLSLDFAGLTMHGTSSYDSTRSNILQQWSPNLDIDLKRAYINYAALDYILQVPDIKFNYKPERCEIASANVVFGNSDFYLSGAVTGLEKWISDQDMLMGDLYFTSNYTNVDDLMNALSGLGSDPDTLQQQREEDKVEKEANPFIVPKDVEFTLHTRIKDCTAFGNDLQELAGDVKVCDGIAVLDQVGFVCKAATMQLTAMYKTPRVNHIFLGLDFHLLDISISELIDMIPMVDTLVPMLSSFDGNADFHLCAETYVDALYQPKYSTLRGAASIKGDSLVVLDNETFDKISKLLMFKKKAKNVIDSLEVQMTVFRKEVEIYPFSLNMDKYQVIASGRHNLDMNYDYHLEIIRSPLPTRLAVDALGVMPKIGIRLSKCRYEDLYRPEKADALEKRTMALKKMIHESLEANVKESTRQYKGLPQE